MLRGANMMPSAETQSSHIIWLRPRIGCIASHGTCIASLMIRSQALSVLSVGLLLCRRPPQRLRRRQQQQTEHNAGHRL